MIALKVRLAGHHSRCDRILPGTQIHREATAHRDLRPGIHGANRVTGMKSVNAIHILPQAVADGVTKNQFLERLPGFNGGGEGHRIAGSDHVDIRAVIALTQDQAHHRGCAVARDRLGASVLVMLGDVPGRRQAGVVIIQHALGVAIAGDTTGL